MKAFEMMTRLKAEGFALVAVDPDEELGASIYVFRKTSDKTNIDKAIWVKSEVILKIVEETYEAN